MATEKSSPRPTASGRSPRWSSARSSPAGSNRLVFRLIGIPALAFAGVLIYRGVQERFTLPECDSSRARQTLSHVLSPLKVEPLRDAPIKRISSRKERVVCNVALPLSDGGSLNIDYNFFWQGNTADVRYSISRKPAQKSGIEPPQAPVRTD
jgi:hypothetical protein